MKKLSCFLCIVFLIVALLLTGCSVEKDNATGLPNDNVSKVSNPIEEPKGSDNSLDLENKNDLAKANQSRVGVNKQDVTHKDNTQNQASAPNTIESPTTMETKSSLPTAAIQAPIPITPEKTDEKEVTLAIYCSTAVAKGLDKQDQFKGVVPADGIILPSTKVKFKDGETVFDVLKLVVRENKIPMQYEGSKGTPYIKGINNLYEFDGGPLSGWMFSVNKVYTNYGCNQTKLKNGDLIEWNYTCDMGKDLAQ